MEAQNRKTPLLKKASTTFLLSSGIINGRIRGCWKMTLASRASRLSLLAKMDDNQFTSPELIDLNQVLREGIENFQELTDVKIDRDIEADVQVKMDRYLASVSTTCCLMRSSTVGKNRRWVCN